MLDGPFVFFFYLSYICHFDITKFQIVILLDFNLIFQLQLKQLFPFCIKIQNNVFLLWLIGNGWATELFSLGAFLALPLSLKLACKIL